MASYFDEHDCLPLGENERPNDHLLLSRLLLDSGILTAMGMDFQSFSASNNVSNLPPPASKRWLTNELPKYYFNEWDKVGYQCPICLNRFEEKSSDNGKETSSTTHQNKCVTLPDCKHSFHVDCLIRWLEHTSSCPLCRYDLPTDDANYEEFKRQKKREKTRLQDLADLHDSMYS